MAKKQKVNPTRSAIDRVTKVDTHAIAGHPRLNIRVYASGNKSWYYHYTMPNDSTVIRYKFAKYPDLLIKDIKPMTLEFDRQIALGNCPKKLQEEAKAAQFATVADMLDAYELIKSQPDNKIKTLDNVMDSLRLNTKLIKDMLVKDVTPKILREQVYQPIIDRGSDSALIQFKSYLSSVFNRALEWDNHIIPNKPLYNFAIATNPVVETRLKDGKEPKGKARNRFLTLQEIHDLVNSPHLQPILKLKLKLIISLGQRLKQIIQSPISAVDFNQKTWAWLLDEEGRPMMKRDYDPDNDKHNHIIPLTDFHIELIQQNMAMNPSYKGWLFPKDLHPYSDEPMSTVMRPIGKHCKELKIAIPFQARDFRRTFKTQGNEKLGIPRSNLDAVQHHSGSSSADVNYDWSKHMHEKWDALKKWSDLMEEVYKPDWKEEEDDDNLIEFPWRKAI